MRPALKYYCNMNMRRADVRGGRGGQCREVIAHGKALLEFAVLARDQTEGRAAPEQRWDKAGASAAAAAGRHGGSRGNGESSGEGWVAGDKGEGSKERGERGREVWGKEAGAGQTVFHIAASTVEHGCKEEEEEADGRPLHAADLLPVLGERVPAGGVGGQGGVSLKSTGGLGIGGELGEEAVRDGASGGGRGGLFAREPSPRYAGHTEPDKGAHGGGARGGDEGGCRGEPAGRGSSSASPGALQASLLRSASEPAELGISHLPVATSRQQHAGVHGGRASGVARSHSDPHFFLLASPSPHAASGSSVRSPQH